MIIDAAGSPRNKRGASQERTRDRNAAFTRQTRRKLHAGAFRLLGVLPRKRGAPIAAAVLTKTVLDNRLASS